MQAPVRRLCTASCAHAHREAARTHSTLSLRSVSLRSLSRARTRRGSDEVVQARAHAQPRLGQAPAARWFSARQRPSAKRGLRAGGRRGDAPGRERPSSTARRARRAAPGQRGRYIGNCVEKLVRVRGAPAESPVPVRNLRATRGRASGLSARHWSVRTHAAGARVSVHVRSRRQALSPGRRWARTSR